MSITIYRGILLKKPTCSKAFIASAGCPLRCFWSFGATCRATFPGASKVTIHFSGTLWISWRYVKQCQTWVLVWTIWCQNWGQCFIPIHIIAFKRKQIDQSCYVLFMFFSGNFVSVSKRHIENDKVWKGLTLVGPHPRMRFLEYVAVDPDVNSGTPAVDHPLHADTPLQDAGSYSCITVLVYLNSDFEGVLLMARNVYFILTAA